MLSIFALIFSPILAGILLYTPFFKGNGILIRRFSKAFGCLHFLYAILFLMFFNPYSDRISYVKELKFFDTSWVQSMGFDIAFGMDGISLLMVILTTFVFVLALFASKSSISTKPKFYYSMMFLLETSVLGVFCAQDMLTFFMFWELELIPMYFLISQWGSGKSKASAMKFVLYTFLGSMFMLVGMLLLHFYNFASYGILTDSFSELDISAPQFSLFMQMLISILLLIGFAVKLPIVPLHTWLPDAHTDAPTPVSMILAGVLLKMGAYGIIRFNIQILPEAFKLIAPVLAIFALVNIIYTAMVAYVQSDIKRIVAYSSISNMGIVLLGLCSLNIIGLSGAIFLMLAHGVVAAGLFMLVGTIYVRTKTREMLALSGLGYVMPRLMGFALVLAMAAVGMPLLMGFVGELLVFIGAYNAEFEPFRIYTILAIFVLVLSASYMFKFIHRTFFSNIFENWHDIKDITTNEFTVLMSVVLTVIFFGIFPMSIINIIQPLLINILQYIQI